jgi:cyanate lyase
MGPVGKRLVSRARVRPRPRIAARAEFGDGIMNEIDLEMTLERQPDAKGDRVRITPSGEFLPCGRN